MLNSTDNDREYESNRDDYFDDDEGDDDEGPQHKSESHDRYYESNSKHATYIKFSSHRSKWCLSSAPNTAEVTSTDRQEDEYDKEEKEDIGYGQKLFAGSTIEHNQLGSDIHLFHKPDSEIEDEVEEEK